MSKRRRHGKYDYCVGCFWLILSTFASLQHCSVLRSIQRPVGARPLIRWLSDGS